MQHVTLYLAKTLFASLVKNLFDLLAHSGFYVPIKIIKGHTKTFGEIFSHRGLACAHIPYQNDAYHQSLLLLMTAIHSSYVRASALSCIALGRR